MAEQILDSKDCNEALKKFLNSENFQLRSFHVVGFHNPLQGLIGQHFTLKVEYECENETKKEEFFVKTLSTNKIMLEFSRSLMVYEKEKLFYSLLEECGRCGIDTTFAPRAVFFKPDVVVLEDLSKEYKGTPRWKFLDFDHSRNCLVALAKFHAMSILYEKKKEKELGKKFSLNDENMEVLEEKMLSKKEDFLPAKYLSSVISGIFQLIDLICGKDAEEFKNKLMEILSLENDKGSSVCALLHGDLWTSNFLHSYENDKPVETKLIDYQFLKYGPVEEDLLSFIMTNTTREFRRENFTNLIEHYHKNLSRFLMDGGLKEGLLPPLEEFVISCNNFKLPGKIHAVVDHSSTFMGHEIYGDIMKSEESLKKFFFEDGGKYILESYNCNEMYRGVLREDVLELRDLVFGL